MMKPILAWLNNMFSATPQTLRPWRWTILLIFGLSTAFMMYGMATRLNMDMSFDSWFQEDDPAKIALNDFRHEFGSDDGLYVIYHPKDDDVFSYDSLRLIGELVSELENPIGVVGLDKTTRLAHIDKITALTNSRYQKADGDVLISKKMVSGEVPNSKSELTALKQIALSQESFTDAYFSKDFKYGGFQIKTDFGTIPKNSAKPTNEEFDPLAQETAEISMGEDFSMEVDKSAVVEKIEFEDVEMEEYVNFMADFRKVVGQAKYADYFEFYPVGNAPMMDFAMASMGQAVILLLLMVLIIIGLLWTLLRSLSAVVWPMVVICGSMFWTIGATAWLGVEVSTMISLTAMLIVTVGVADTVHVLSTYLFHRRHDVEHEEAMTKTYRKTGVPILITTMTTMSGMLALTITGLHQFVVFGIMSATGVALAWLFTWLVLPVCLDIWHPLKGKTSAHVKKDGIVWWISAGWLQPALDKIPAIVRRSPAAIVALFVVVFVVFAYGTQQVKVNTNIVELTKEGSDLRIAYNLVDEKMMGAQNMEVMVDFAKDDALKNAQVLQAIDTLEQRLNAHYSEYVKKTFSIAGVVKDTNRIMNAGEQSFYKVPQGDTLTGQLLYLFSTANPEDRRLLVNDSFSKTHISVQLKNTGSYEYRDFFQGAATDIDSIFAPLKQQYPDLEVTVTGGLALMMKLTQSMAESQLNSFLFAIIIISMIMILTLGSFQGGAISILPNIIPAIFTFGVMGLLGIPLDTDTMIIAPLIIGIAVDDTIHFITHYRDAWMQTGQLQTALRSTLKEVGQAITFTSMILGIGFFVLSFSDYGGISKIGTFGSMAIFVALACDLVLFPALIYIFKPTFGMKFPEAEPAQI